MFFGTVRATARELKTDRNVVYRRLRALGINTARISKGPVIAPQQLEESYQTHRGDITKMVEQLGTSWIDVYKALDEYGYLERHRRPVTCAQAAAAYYKFGSTTKAGEHLGVSATLIRKKSREAKYIRKYGRGRKNKVIV